MSSMADFIKQAGKKVPPALAYNYAGQIIAYEQGDLDADESLGLFAFLIRTGLAWQLQGSYGRTAAELINSGRISDRGEILDVDE